MQAFQHFLPDLVLGAPHRTAVLQQEALNGGGSANDERANVLAKTRDMLFDLLEHVPGFALLLLLIFGRMIARVTGVRPLAQVGGDGHHHQLARRAQAGIDEGIDIQGQVGRIDYFSVFDVNFPGICTRRNGLPVHHHIEGHAGIGGHQRLRPLQPLRGNMLRAHQLAIDIPYRGIGDDTLRPDLDAALQADTAGLVVFNEYLVHQLPVKHLPAAALEGFFHRIGQHLRPTGREVHSADVIVDEHGGCHDRRSLFRIGIGIGRAQFIEKIEYSRGMKIFLEQIHGTG